MSNDISKNPGPRNATHNDVSIPYFSFCNWNLNTLSKYVFTLVSLLSAHNSIHRYGIISSCETSLNYNAIVPTNISQGYQYHGCNQPSGEKKGDVAIFHQDYLIRSDFSFDGCIVAELGFGRKIIYFTAVYRNPKHKIESPEFLTFMSNTQVRNHIYLFLHGDFNAHSVHWWHNGCSTNHVF